MTKHRKQITLGLSLAVAIALVVPSTVVAQGASQKTPAMATPAKAPAAPTTAKSSAHATETIEYKDPEDMTTRYRPGNNKTTAVSPDVPKPASDAKDKVTIPACDGASKDAAKCAAASPAPSVQAATHKGKIDSFTVKQ